MVKKNKEETKCQICHTLMWAGIYYKGRIMCQFCAKKLNYVKKKTNYSTRTIIEFNGYE